MGLKRVGAIDCGTNSIRLLIADVVDGRLRDVHREMRIVRLGQGVDATGQFAPEALARTESALADYAALMSELEVSAVRMVATSAARDAGNRDEFFAITARILGTVLEGDLRPAVERHVRQGCVDNRFAHRIAVEGLFAHQSTSALSSSVKDLRMSSAKPNSDRSSMRCG